MLSTALDLNRGPPSKERWKFHKLGETWNRKHFWTALAIQMQTRVYGERRRLHETKLIAMSTILSYSVCIMQHSIITMKAYCS